MLMYADKATRRQIFDNGFSSFLFSSLAGGRIHKYRWSSSLNHENNADLATHWVCLLLISSGCLWPPVPAAVFSAFPCT